MKKTRSQTVVTFIVVSIGITIAVAQIGLIVWGAQTGIVTKEDAKALFFGTGIDGSFRIAYQYEGDPTVYNDFAPLKDLTSLKDVQFLEVNGEFILGTLATAENVRFPKKIVGTLYLDDLQSAKGLELPEVIEGDGTNLTQGSIGPLGSLNLTSLRSAEGVRFPREIEKYLNLRNLTAAEDLVLPEKVGEDLNLSNLRSAKGLKLPKEVGRDLNLYKLTTAEGVEFPERVGGDVILSSLATTKGLVLPREIGSSLYLDNLASAEGLVLPEKIGGSIYLDTLISTKGLKIKRDKVEGNLYINTRTVIEDRELLKKIRIGKVDTADPRFD